MTDLLLEAIRDISGISAILRTFGEAGAGGDGIPAAMIFLSERIEDALIKLDEVEKEVRNG